MKDRMVEELKKQIDNNQDSDIEGEELLNFLKSQENIKELENALKMNGGREQVLNALPHLQEVVKQTIKTMYGEINKRRSQNNSTEDMRGYTSQEIALIQFYANLEYGDNLSITGKRKGYKTTEDRTNLYIWRLELENRQGLIDEVKFKELLTIPNLEELLGTLETKQQQDAVLKQFLDFFLNNVRTMGMEFENGAGDENLQALLNFLILAEKNKGTPEGDKYRKLATDLQNGIDEVVKTNARNNTYAVINQKFQAIDKAKDGDKEALANLYKELFPSIEKVKKSDLSRQVLLSLSTYFTAKEIETLFKGVEFNGDGVINALEMSRRDIESEVKEYESTNDILAQVSQLTEKSENFSEDVGQGRGIERPTWQEFASARPTTANKIKMDLGRQYEIPTNANVPRQYARLTAPGCLPILVHTGELTLKNGEIRSSLGNILSNKNLVLVNYHNFPRSIDIFMKKNKDTRQLSADNFATFQKDKEGNIQLFKIGEAKPYKTITVEEQQKARNANQLALMSINTPEVQKVRNDVVNIQGQMKSIQETYDKMGTAENKVVNRGEMLFSVAVPAKGVFDFVTGRIDTYITTEGGLSDEDVKDIFTKIDNLKLEVNALKYQRGTLKSIQQQVENMLKNVDKTGLTTNDELQLQQALNAVNCLLDGIAEGGQISKFIEYMNAKKVSSNDSFREQAIKWLKDNSIQILCAIGCAVAVMAAPFSGGMSLLGVAALSTAAGMVGSRVGQFANEQLRDKVFTTEVEINGVKKKIDYDNPTDVELVCTGQMEPGEFVKGIGMEFIIGTASVYGFMKVGQMVGSNLSAFANKHPGGTVDKMLKVIKPGLSTGDPYTQQIFENAAKNGIKNGWFARFRTEFGQELFEESYETAAEQTNIPGLSMLASIYSCLTPSPGHAKIFAGNKIAVNNVIPSKADHTNTLELTYQGKEKEILDYCTNLSQYPFKYDEVTGTLRRKSPFVKKGGNLTEVIKLTPSKVSAEIRAMGPTLSSNYGIEIDHENGTLIAFDSEKLSEFQKSIQEHGLGQVITDEFGNMKLITGKDTKQILRIKPNPEAVKANASLDDKARILKAKELLKGKELTPEQEQAILEAHNQEGTIYNLTHEQIRSRVEILQNAGFTSGEIRVLFENGIVGKNNMEIKTEVKPLDIQSREVNNQIDSKTNPQEKSISDAQELKLLQEKYPYLLTRITNPETLSEIITTEVGKGNLILNVDGTVKEAFVEINGEKKSSQLFEKMKKDYDEEQALRTWLQVRTPEFKEWFGDWQGTDKAKVSRVVDENGEPLIVYHGTSREFNEFRKDVPRNFNRVENTNDRHYFTTNKEFVESEYAEKGYNDFRNTVRYIGDKFSENGETDDISQIKIWNEFIDAIIANKVNFYRDVFNHLYIEEYKGHKNFLAPEIFYKKIPQKEDFINFERGSEDGSTIIVYTPETALVQSIIPAFIKSNDISIIKSKQDESIFWMDNQIDKAIASGTDKTDVIMVEALSTGAKILGVKNANQIKSAINNNGSFSPKTAKFNDYFGKESKFGFDSKEAYQNSESMNEIISEIARTENTTEPLKKLEQMILAEHDRIAERFKKNGKEMPFTREEASLVEDQLRSLIEAHQKPGELGKLSQSELREKWKILTETIANNHLKRFLLEGGFSGENKDNIEKYIHPNGEEIRKKIENIQEDIKAGKEIDKEDVTKLLDNLKSVGIPRRYIDLLEGVGIDDIHIWNRYKNWLTDERYKRHIEQIVKTRGLTLEEAYVIFGYTNIFNNEIQKFLREKKELIHPSDIKKSLNLLDTELESLNELTNIFDNGLNKMPNIEGEILFRGDKSIYWKNYSEGSEVQLRGYTSGATNVKDIFLRPSFLENDVLIEIKVMEGRAKDISELAMFVNFAENINKKELQTTNESILLRGSSGTITSIQEGYVFEDKDGNRIPVKKITIEQTK